MAFKDRSQHHHLKTHQKLESKDQLHASILDCEPVLRHRVNSLSEYHGPEQTERDHKMNHYRQYERRHRSDGLNSMVPDRFNCFITQRDWFPVPQSLKDLKHVCLSPIHPSASATIQPYAPNLSYLDAATENINVEVKFRQNRLLYRSNVAVITISHQIQYR